MAQHQEHARGHVDASNGDGRVISTAHDQVPNFAFRPTAATTRDGNWSDPATWETHRVPSHHDIVLIRSQHRVVYDVVGKETLAAMGIEGVLAFSIDRNTRLESRRNMSRALRQSLAEFREPCFVRWMLVTAC